MYIIRLCIFDPIQSITSIKTKRIGETDLIQLDPPKYVFMTDLNIHGLLYIVFY